MRRHRWLSTTRLAALVMAVALLSLPLALGEACSGGETGRDRASAGAVQETRWSDAIRGEVARMGEGRRPLRAEAERLEAIVGAHGWPTAERAGREAASAAYEVALGAIHDPAFQDAYRDFLERQYREGVVPGEAVALLTDRLRRARGEPQLYGTQTTVQGGQLVLEPIEDSVRVDRRRGELGLPPLGAYLRRLRAAYSR